jgi:hypothetical protein
MSKTIGRLLALCAVLALMLAVGACVREPFAPPQYAVPAPPPLQPYVEPPVPVAAVPLAEPATPVTQRGSAKTRQKREPCPCLPVR